jgi:hypothetical protein
VETAPTIIDYEGAGKAAGGGLQFTFPVGHQERRKLRWLRFPGALGFCLLLTLSQALASWALDRLVLKHSSAPLVITITGGVAVSLVCAAGMSFALAWFSRGTIVDISGETVSVRRINRDRGKSWSRQKLRWISVQPVKGSLSKNVMASLYLQFGYDIPVVAGTGDCRAVAEAAKSIGDLLGVPIKGLPATSSDGT